MACKAKRPRSVYLLADSMRPNVSPLLAAFTALRASESAERKGDIDEAARQAWSAMEAVQAWRDQLGLAQLAKNEAHELHVFGNWYVWSKGANPYIVRSQNISIDSPQKV